MVWTAIGGLQTTIQQRSRLAAFLAAFLLLLSSLTMAVSPFVEKAFAGSHLPVDLITVKEGSANGWYFAADSSGIESEGNGQFVAGPETPPLGNGSAELVVDGDDRHVLALTSQYAGLDLFDISNLSYSTYRSQGDIAVAPALQLNIDTDNTDEDTSWQGRLVYEPYHDNAVATGQWQTWRTTSNDAGWWFSGAPGNNVCPQSNPCTWNEVVTEFPNAEIRNTGYTGLLFKAGGWTGGFTGNVDNFNIETATFSTTYDFEGVLPNTSGPRVKLLSPNSGSTIGGVVTVEVEAVDLDGVASVNLKFLGKNDSRGYGLQQVGDSNIWKITLNTNDFENGYGQYTIKFSSLDDRGKSRSSKSNTIKIDNASPAIGFISHDEGSRIGGEETVRIKVSDNSLLNYVNFKLVDGRFGESPNYKMTEVETGIYEVTFDTRGTVPTGESSRYNFKVSTEDEFSNNRSSKLSVLVDNEAPKVSIESPGVDNQEISGEVNVKLQATGDNLKSHWVEITGPSDYVEYWHDLNASDGTFMFNWDTSALVDGSYRIRYVAMDTLGNRSDDPNYSNPTLRHVVVNNSPVLTADYFVPQADHLSVGFTIDRFDEASSVEVELLDANKNSIVKNVGDSSLMKSLLNSHTGQISSPFYISDDATNDDYWTFGEVDWRNIATPEYAVVTVNYGDGSSEQDEVALSASELGFSFQALIEALPELQRGNLQNDAQGPSNRRALSVVPANIGTLLAPGLNFGNVGQGFGPGGEASEVLGENDGDKLAAEGDGNIQAVSTSITDTQEESSSCASFLGLCWYWWVPVVIVVVGIIYALFRPRKEA